MHSLGGASARSFGCGQNPVTTKEFDKTRVMGEGGTGAAGGGAVKPRATHKIERNYREERRSAGPVEGRGGGGGGVADCGNSS